MIRIAHLADIHIRGLSRHTEYEKVLQAFIDDCKDNHVDHIMIAGDVWHTKTTGLTAEYIKFLTWMLAGMSQVAHVHIMLGNHDLNLSNLSRLDAITPIVDALNNSRIHIYKMSGIYEFAPGFVWCNFGIFDIDGWESVKPVPGKVNIACFHGPVAGARTDNNWMVEGDVNVKFFEQFDFGFLGDLHAHQSLATRSVEGKEKPWLIYPGSAIQQNYGETLDHGYLLWNIESRDNFDVEFRKLPNPQPYITVEWKGDRRDLVAEVGKFPHRSRVRIKSSTSITQREIYQITTSLQKFEPTEVTFKVDQQVNKDAIDVGSMVIGRNDLRNPDVLMKLMKDFYEGSSQVVTEPEWEVVGGLVAKYVKSIADFGDVARNTKWSIKSLEFDNLYGYGENNCINFGSLEGITGIFGPNRSGKSSIVGALMYTLFNTTDRGPIKNMHIMNVRKDYCRGKARVSVNGTDYIIDRQTTKHENKDGVITAGTSLNMFSVDEKGELHDMCGEQRFDTDGTIRKMIGTSTDFVRTSLSMQGDHNRFISEGATQRKLILAKFMDLDIFDAMHDISKRDVADLKAQLRNIHEQDWEAEIRAKRQLKESTQGEMDSLERSLADARSTLERLQMKAASRRTESVMVTDTQVKTQVEKVLNLEAQISDVTGQIEKITTDIEGKRAKLITIEEIRGQFDIKEMRRQLELIRKLESTVDDLTRRYKSELEVLKRQERSIKLLKTVPCGDHFPGCKFIKESHADKEKAIKQALRVKSFLEKLDLAKDSFDEAHDEELVGRIGKFEKVNDLQSNLQKEVSQKDVELHKLEMALSMYSASLKKEKARLETYEEAFRSTSNVEEIMLRNEIDSVHKVIKDLDSQKTTAATLLGQLTAEISKLISTAQEHRQLQTTLRYYELIDNAFSKRGIPANIVDKQLPIINAELAEILHGIVDFTVELEVDPDSNDVPVYINYGDSRRIIELCSGMEKMISSMAIRVALLNITSLPKTDIFFIDEGFGVLDESNVESCNKLILSLKKSFKNIVIISHVDAVKDIADNVIEITKSEKDSQVQCN